MKKIESKIGRLRLEKLTPESTNVTHDILFRRRKGGLSLYMPLSGAEARRIHMEDRWCYWLTLTCPTDRIKRGDLVLDVPNQTTLHIELDVTEEFLNIVNNDNTMEKVIASRYKQHNKLQIGDDIVIKYITRAISNRVEVDYEIETCEENCPTCKGVGRHPKYPQFKCNCNSGKVIKKIITPVNKDGQPIVRDHQNVFTRHEVIQKLHGSLEATTSSYGPLGNVFTKQLDEWIDKNI